MTSENLYPGQKEFIESKLGGRVFTFYGHSEGACIAGWCEYEDKYHENCEYGYTELIDGAGRVIHEPNIKGEIVATSFGNYIMPLIRYKTGDYSSWSDKTRCSCGRNYRILNSINGRWTQEFFIGKQGNKISMAAINMHDSVFDNVRNYQFEQNEKGKCTLRIVKGDAYADTDETIIKNNLNQKFNGTMDINVEYVDDLSRTLRGKQRFIIQNINERNLT